MDKKSVNWTVRILFLIGILVSVAILSLLVGSAGIPLKDIIHIILKGRGTAEHSIIFDIRLPRILLGFAIGGSLSLAGVILQGMFRNPLVEPYTLGISGGSALGVSLAIVLGLQRLAVLSLPVAGFFGATAVIALIYLLSMRKGMLKIQGLLLTGVMISFIASSLIMVIMSVSRAENLHGIVFWIMGSLEEPNWTLIKSAVVLAFISLVISYRFSLDLNAMSLGEEEAQHLGINVERTKRFLFLLASLLTGFSVSVAGMIGFVGLVVPHFVRTVFGGDHRVLLAGSFLAGGAFLIFCDTLARIVISPLELPVGVITGILGGSLFIYTLTKHKRD